MTCAYGNNYGNRGARTGIPRSTTCSRKNNWVSCHTIDVPTTGHAPRRRQGARRGQRLRKPHRNDRTQVVCHVASSCVVRCGPIRRSNFSRRELNPEPHRARSNINAVVQLQVPQHWSGMMRCGVRTVRSTPIWADASEPTSQASINTRRQWCWAATPDNRTKEPPEAALTPDNNISISGR